MTDDGDAYVWGYGDLGQLGRGSDQSDALTPVRLAPTKAMGGKRVVDVSFGGQHTARREGAVTPLHPALPDFPYLYMTGHGEVRFSPQERAALRSYLTNGGFLHADDNYGLDESFRREVSEIFPEHELTEIPPDHPVFGVFYELPDGLPKVHEHGGLPPQALGIFHGGRLVVFYSYESDLGDGWEDPDVHGDDAAVREDALRMGVNLFLYALGQPAS